MAKFSIGNQIRHKEKGHILTIIDIFKTGDDSFSYEFKETNIALAIKNEDLYELVIGQGALNDSNKET